MVGAMQLPNWLTDDAQFPLPTVLLRHDLPDGSSHVDWMVARDSRPGAALITFRLPSRLDELTSSTHGLKAERIADHRAEYLVFQGEIAGDRGQVTRLRAGFMLAHNVNQNGEAHLRIRWHAVKPELLGIEQDVRIVPQNSTQVVLFCDSIH